jgi:PAS domain S-box-containing protein
MAESIPHIVWMAAPDGSTKSFNRMGADYVGLSPGANTGWKWIALVHPDDAERVQRCWENAVHTSTPHDLEYRIRRADGAYRWHAVRGQPLWDGDGRVRKWIGTATDIDDRKRTEEDLRRVHRRIAETLTVLETLQATAPVGFAFIDRDFRIVRINDKLAAINRELGAEDGASSEAQVGRRVAEVVPTLWPQIEQIYRHVLDTGEPVLDQVLSRESGAAPGETRYWLTNHYPVSIGDEIIGIGAVVVDITESKQAETARSALTRSAVAAIAATVEARDPYTAGHQRRVADIATAIATELGLDTHAVEGIGLAAAIHDIGKVRIPAEIFSRPSKLRPGEWELVRSHSRDGHEIVAGIAFPWPVAGMILQHHERCDGSGYPHGLRGEQILIGARIIGVADVVDARQHDERSADRDRVGGGSSKADGRQRGQSRQETHERAKARPRAQNMRFCAVSACSKPEARLCRMSISTGAVAR